MAEFEQCMNRFKDSLTDGWVVTAYRGLMEFLMDLRTRFAKKYPGFFISGSIYQGYMDMSYFAIAPESLAKKKLKVAIVFNYQDFQFEAYLIGVNKKIQSQYIQHIRESGWNQYKTAPSSEGFDYIIMHPLIDSPDFNNLPRLSEAIESGVISFTKEVEHFLDRIG